jgi:hypothetical protein
MMETKMNKLAMALGALVTLIVISALSGFIVMLLWNWLVVSIFGLGEISWLQGWGIMILSNLLFKSVRKGK